MVLAARNYLFHKGHMSNNKFIKQRLNKLIGKPKTTLPPHTHPVKTKIIRPPPPRSSLFKDYTYITIQKRLKNQTVATPALCYNDHLVFHDHKGLLSQHRVPPPEADNDEESESWLIREEILKGCDRLR